MILSVATAMTQSHRFAAFAALVLGTAVLPATPQQVPVGHYPDDWLHPADQMPPQRQARRTGPKSPNDDAPVVRAAYLIPANRTAQTQGVESFRTALTRTRDYYRDQMVANGNGPRTFAFETESDGASPMIHLVKITETDDYLRDDLWSRTLAAAASSGIPLWTPGQIWILVPESHLQNADGSLTPGVALGASFGSGDDPGVVLMESAALARFKYLADDRSYAGLVVPELGPYPLVANVSFPWFEGATLSSTASSVLGALMHELGHGFGLPHDFRNDTNMLGNLMGNGLRGIRGNFYPARYPEAQTWLSTASARALAVSRYFGGTAGENDKPAVTILTSGNVTPAAGLLAIQFTAADPSGLVAAHLAYNGNRVAEMALAGPTFSGSFQTAEYQPGTAATYQIAVFDAHGNKQTVETSITPIAIGNRAPLAHFRVSRTIGFFGEEVVLDAASSSDPDAGAVLTFEWDLDGDGVFESPPSLSPRYTLTLDSPGSRRIAVRVTDQAAAAAVSAPLVVETHRPNMNLTLQPAGTVLVQWPSRLGVVYQPAASGNLAQWQPVGSTPIHGDGNPCGFQDAAGGATRGFYQIGMTRRTGP